MRRNLRSLLRRTDGTAIVEFSLVLPVMLLMTAGVVEYGVAFQAFNGANRLAAQYAAAWADCSDNPAGTCATELTTLASTMTVANIVPQLAQSRLTLTLAQVQMSSSGPVAVYAYPTGRSLTDAEKTAAAATIPTGQVGVVVTTTYTHQFQLFSAFLSGVPSNWLSATYTIAQLKS
ncbi:MAG: pilus assembly protein [Methylobacteriaceae bacterium]|nr:pilus assembly protein [Methylobacteriaceae bacterium]